MTFDETIIDFIRRGGSIAGRPVPGMPGDSRDLNVRVYLGSACVMFGAGSADSSDRVQKCIVEAMEEALVLARRGESAAVH